MREKNTIFVSKSKGELNMKRSILTLALVVAFVLAFGAAAQATFRGFTPIRTQAEVDAGMLQGFITFPEARAEMERNFGAGGAFEGDVGATLQNTAHGGYVTTTTKCVVCHSAHRAPGVNPDAIEGPTSSSSGGTNLANVQNQSFLTAGSATCESCHVASGVQSSRLLVEWGPNGGGPHAAPRRGCMFCHNAGIHGLSGSSFNVMNVFMLGNTRRGTDGGPSPTGIETRDQQIRREIEEGRVLRGGMLDVPVNSSFPAGTNVAPTPTTGSTWWYNGTRALGPIGALPGVDDVNGMHYGAARSLATAYTCGEQGCHVTTAMFNLNWGMGFDRADRVTAATGTIADGDHVRTGGNPTGTARMEVTGHIMPSLRSTGGANGNTCGPCHGGNASGFPTASTVAGTVDLSRRAYGCDQCHDMVGVATNSTAWPHGNRDILVYEWDADGVQHENMMAAGNLWMYSGNIARSADAPNLTGNPGAAAQRALGPTSVNPFFADQSWIVLTGVTNGRYGLPNNPAGSYFDHPTYGAYAPAGSTGLTDGSCLKCHVALDPASLGALNSVGADAIRHTWPGTQGGPLNPSWDGSAMTGSARLFLYR